MAYSHVFIWQCGTSLRIITAAFPDDFNQNDHEFLCNERYFHQECPCIPDVVPSWCFSWDSELIFSAILMSCYISTVHAVVLLYVGASLLNCGAISLQWHHRIRVILNDSICFVASWMNNIPVLYIPHRFLCDYSLFEIHFRSLLAFLDVWTEISPKTLLHLLKLILLPIPRDHPRKPFETLCLFRRTSVYHLNLKSGLHWSGWFGMH